MFFDNLIVEEDTILYCQSIFLFRLRNGGSLTGTEFSQFALFFYFLLLRQDLLPDALGELLEIIAIDPKSIVLECQDPPALEVTRYLRQYLTDILPPCALVLVWLRIRLLELEWFLLNYWCSFRGYPSVELPRGERTTANGAGV